MFRAGSSRAAGGRAGISRILLQTRVRPGTSLHDDGVATRARHGGCGRGDICASQSAGYGGRLSSDAFGGRDARLAAAGRRVETRSLSSLDSEQIALVTKVLGPHVFLDRLHFVLDKGIPYGPVRGPDSSSVSDSLCFWDGGIHMRNLLGIALLLVASCPVFAGTFEVQVGYADDLRPSPFFPTPW